MKTPSSVKVVNYVETDYGASIPPMQPDQRGDERVVECIFAQGKSKIRVNISEDNAARTRYGVYLLFPGDKFDSRREADLMLTRRQLLTLPSVLKAAIREGDKIGMFDRGPGLWARREMGKGEATS